MKNINILDSNTIDKIAAGEVVERPSAVIKELVENSIDAGANIITIEIKDGGISFIRVTDNGEGIDRSQIKKAFMRHATSKIKDIEDLISVTSLGFRGEALSSISSVAKVELLTKTKEEFIGTRYVVEGGRENVFEDAGVPDGTTILVKELFYNIPARRKFLKTAQTEGNYITELIEHMILSHPDVSFKLINNGKIKLQSSGNGDIKSSIYTVYGRDVVNNLIEIEAKRDDISIHGYIGKPELARSTRNHSIYFVNNRYIRSSLIDRALDEAYKYHLMLHKYPTVFLYFDIPSYLIDVNVHPTKKEIRFIEGDEIHKYIVEEINKTLNKSVLIKEINISNNSNNKTDNIVLNENPEPFEINSIKVKESFNRDSVFIEKESVTDNVKSKAEVVNSSSQKNTDLSSQCIDETSFITEDASFVKYDTLDSNTKHNTEAFHENNIDEYVVDNKQITLFDEGFLSKSARVNHKIIGQLFNTYWLVEFENKLYIIDQHAAHEKVNYERMIKKLRNNEVISQNIYPPVVITLTNSEEEYVKRFNDSFSSIGFTIEHFGGKEYTISTVPLELLSQNPADYFHEMLDELIDGKFTSETQTVNLKIATMACKASVKGNMKLSVLEAEALIDELLTLDNPYNCPHGRPTIISYSKYEIEKMFKRIVN